jgi:transposase-like protein
MKTRTRRSHAVWLSLIQQQIESGITAAEFCRQHTLNDKYFSKRKRELQAGRKASASGNPFIKVQAAQRCDQESVTTLVLHYHNTQLHIPAAADLHALAQLMALLP